MDKPDEIDIDDADKRVFNIDLFKGLHTYANKKQYFEIFCIKMRMGEYWFTSERTEHADGGWREAMCHTKMSTYQLLEAFGDLDVGLIPSESGKKAPDGSIVLGRAGSSGDFPKPDKFIERWARRDEDKRSLCNVDFYPSPVAYECVVHTHNTFNTFLGYPRFLFDVSLEYGKREEQLLLVWRDVLRNLISGQLTREQSDHTLHAVECLLAHSIFSPAQRMQHGLIIQSQEGEGKGSICQTLCDLVGSEHYFSTSNVSDLFGSHSESMENRLFVNLDEVHFTQVKDAQGRLKALITAPRWQINPKNVRPYEVNAFASIILTTNSKFSIPLDISKGERRWWVMCGTGKYAAKRMPKSKWAMLHSTDGWRGKPFLRCLFHHLRSVFDANTEYDFNTFKYENSRCAPYRELALNVVPEVAFYLQSFLESKKYVHTCAQYDENGTLDISKIKGRHFEYLLGTDPPDRFDNLPEFNRPLVYSGAELVRDYREWGNANHYNYSSTRNEKSFYRMLQDLCLPVRKIMRNNAVYLEMTMRDVYQTLYNKNYIDIPVTSGWVTSSNDKEEDGDVSKHVCDWCLLTK